MVDARDDRAKRNIATALCNQLITTACGIVTLRVLLASFGSEAYGICASITQFLSYIMLLESGIGGVARAKLYAPLARRDMCEVSAVYNTIRRFFLLCCSRICCLQCFARFDLSRSRRRNALFQAVYFRAGAHDRPVNA